VTLGVFKAFTCKNSEYQTNSDFQVTSDNKILIRVNRALMDNTELGLASLASSWGISSSEIINIVHELAIIKCCLAKQETGLRSWATDK
jgi:hypothetical protein